MVKGSKEGGDFSNSSSNAHGSVCPKKKQNIFKICLILKGVCILKKSRMDFCEVGIRLTGN